MNPHDDLRRLPQGQKIPLRMSFNLVGGGPSTTNSDLATALLSVGIPFKKDKPFEEYGGDMEPQIVYFFEDVSECGEIRTDEMIKAWEDFGGENGWCARNPNHPFAYAAAAAKNRANIIRFVRERAPLIVVKEGNTHAILRAGAPTKYRDQVLSLALRLHRRGWNG